MAPRPSRPAHESRRGTEAVTPAPTRNRLGVNTPRGFESHPLRHTPRVTLRSSLAMLPVNAAIRTRVDRIGWVRPIGVSRSGPAQPARRAKAPEGTSPSHPLRHTPRVTLRSSLAMLPVNAAIRTRVDRIGWVRPIGVSRSGPAQPARRAKAPEGTSPSHPLRHTPRVTLRSSLAMLPVNAAIRTRVDRIGWVRPIGVSRSGPAQPARRAKAPEGTSPSHPLRHTPE